MGFRGEDGFIEIVFRLCLEGSNFGWFAPVNTWWYPTMTHYVTKEQAFKIFRKSLDKYVSQDYVPYTIQNAGKWEWTWQRGNLYFKEERYRLNNKWIYW